MFCQCLEEYRSCPDLLRVNLEGPHQLLLSYSYSHKPVNSQTTARCIRLFLVSLGLKFLCLLHTSEDAHPHPQQTILTFKKQLVGVAIVTFKNILIYLYWKNSERNFKYIPKQMKTVELSCVTVSVFSCIVYTFSWKKVSIDQYCVLQKNNPWLSNLICGIIIFQNKQTKCSLIEIINT